MEIIGFHPQRYTFDDGHTSEGITFFLGEKIDIPGGAGMRTERVYLSNQKVKDYMPCLGDEVLIDRNSNGAARGIICLKPFRKQGA